MTSIASTHISLFLHANCCRNSRLAVAEDELKWVADEKISLFLKQLHCNLIFFLILLKLGLLSGMQNDDLIHREVLKG